MRPVPGERHALAACSSFVILLSMLRVSGPHFLSFQRLPVGEPDALLFCVGA
jgi:hypothetical protein